MAVARGALAALLLLAVPALGQPARPSLHPVATTVGALPANSASAASGFVRLYVVTDGNSATDCTVGGGSTRVICWDNGTTWTAAGSGGGGSGDVTAVGECATGACFPGETMVTSATTVAGDVDGTGVGSLDLDEAAVESELEGVVDLQDLQGAVTDAQVPNGITVTLAATASALAANGANCSAGNYPLGVDAAGATESCTADDDSPDSDAEVPDTITAGQLAANGANCSAGSYARGVDASGAAENCTADSVDGGAAATATALAANGTNCSAGSFPLGVDAAGASESCTAVTSLESSLEGVLDLQDMQGAVTDGQVPNTITIDLATAATALAANGSNCSAGSWAGGVDASGAAEGCTADDDIPDAADYSNLTGGAGIVNSPTGTIATASSEADFLASGALTCGAATQGKAQVHTTPLQYCDNAGTPTLRYAAYGSSAGVATTATALAANGANCSSGNYPLGVDASGAVETCTADDDLPDADEIVESMLKAVDSAVDEECLTYETTTGDFEWQACGAGGDSIRVEDGDNAGTFTALTDADFDDGGDINFVNTSNVVTALVRADSVALGTDTTGNYAGSGSEGGAATTATALAANGANCSAGSYPLGVDASGAVESCTAVVANPTLELNWTASALLPLEHGADSIPPIVLTQGTNVDVLSRGFDDGTDECVGGTFTVPSDVGSGNVTFRAIWNSATATSGNIIWDIRHSGGQAEGVTWDTALTTVAAAADATQGTVKQVTLTSWTETVTNLGWAASDLVSFELCRDANNGSDSLVGDAALLQFSISIPRT